MAGNGLTVKMLLGKPFVTDDLRFKKWLEEEKIQTPDTFEKAFPGFLACCRKVIKELEQDKVPVARLEYIKGKITAHASKEFHHLPSEAFIFILEKA
jgi:hypothetical protein